MEMCLRIETRALLFALSHFMKPGLEWKGVLKFTALPRENRNSQEWASWLRELSWEGRGRCRLTRVRQTAGQCGGAEASTTGMTGIENQELSMRGLVSCVKNPAVVKRTKSRCPSHRSLDDAKKMAQYRSLLLRRRDIGRWRALSWQNINPKDIEGKKVGRKQEWLGYLEVH